MEKTKKLNSGKVFSKTMPTNNKVNPKLIINNVVNFLDKPLFSKYMVQYDLCFRNNHRTFI
jgi:hypothetical protein